MLANPCHAPLVQGIHGTSEGFLTRVKKNIATAAEASGYFLWCPQLHGTRNTFLWNNGTESVAPTLNEYAYGAGWDTTTAGYASDPAYVFVNSQTCADARTISACIDLTYYGAMSSAAGEIAFIENLPLNELLHGGDGAPATVTELFATSTKHMRLGVDTHQIVYRPSHSHGDVFYNASREALDTASATNTSESDLADTKGFKVFGFVWRNVPTGVHQTITMVKNIEWRPEANSGITRVPPRSHGPPAIHHALAYLDTHHPGWTSKVVDGAVGVASSLAKQVFTGKTAHNIIGDVGAAITGKPESLIHDVVSDLGHAFGSLF